jgi:hypothetical protein
MIRSMAASGLAALVLPGLAACEVLRPFNAESTPSNFRYDPTYPVQRLTIDNFERYAAAQEDPVWCWAACAAMVRVYEASGGRAPERVDQEEMARRQAEIVQRIRSRSGESSRSEALASKSEVLGALNPDLYERLLETEERVEASVTDAIVAALLAEDEAQDEWESDSDAVAEEPTEPEPEAPPLGFDAKRLYDALRAGNPVVAALRGQGGTGHVVVVTGAHCQAVPVAAAPGDAGADAVEYRFMAIRIWDPTKDSEGTPEPFGGEFWLAASEFAEHCDFMASRACADAYLAFLEEHAEWAERVFGAPVAAQETTEIDGGGE